MFFHKLMASDRSFIEALESSQAIIEFTPQGRIVRANGNFLNAVGYTEREIVGQHHSIFCAPEYAATQAYRDFWTDMAAGKFRAGEFKRIGKGGRIVWLQASYNPVVDSSGKVVRVVKLASDITEEKALSLDHAGKVMAIGRAQAVIEFSTDGVILTANDNFLETMGYRLDEIQGRHHSLFCDADFAQSAEYRLFWEALSRGEFRAAEYRRVAKGGRPVYIQASYNPIFDDTGAVIKVVKFATDVTEKVNRRLYNDGISRDIDGQLNGVLSQMDAANHMASGASSASTETSSIVSAVAAAAEELSASVRDIGSNMLSAKSSVEGVFKHTETANSFAANLSESAGAMNNVVAFIQNIASQINLLALNATIESARAGDAGKGFAVVASEVKNLANQAAASTKTIGEEIDKIQAVSAEVATALAFISTSMNDVLANVSNVASAIAQQEAVTGEISGNMQSAVTAVHEIEESLIRITEAFTVVTSSSATVKTNVEKLVA